MQRLGKPTFQKKKNIFILLAFFLSSYKEILLEFHSFFLRGRNFILLPSQICTKQQLLEYYFYSISLHKNEISGIISLEFLTLYDALSHGRVA